MVYPIVLYGAPILRKRAKEINKNYEGLDVLLSDMFETMETEGVGLAAPQIGLSLRIFVIDATKMEDEDESLHDFRKVFINPVILEETGEEWLFNEGCLSIPGIREDVSRHEKIRIQYYDQDFNFHDENYEGIRARIIQHEYDHLEGILFTDKLQPLKKKLLKGKLLSISKGKVDTEYKVKVAR